MAQITTRVVEDGSKYALVHLYFESDGSGEVANFPIFVREDHQAPDGGKLAVDKLWPSLSGFDVVLSYDSFPDQPIWVITPYSKHGCFTECIGALKDLGGIDSQSTLLLSTSGFTTVGDRGSLIILIRKG